MENDEQVGKSGFWRRQKASEPDDRKDQASTDSPQPQGGASDTNITPATPTVTSQTSTATSRSLVDETKVKGSKMEIDTLNSRVKELEMTLAAERQAFDAQRQEFLSRPRLEDLGPEDLATESLGAVSEIIKAARAQSTELKRAASEELARAEGEASALRASAAASADETRREAERLASDMASKAKTKAEKVILDAQSEAQTKTNTANAAAEMSRAEAQAQRDSVIEEAQTRLESATNRARKAVENANATAQVTLDSARVAAARAGEEARVTTNEMLKQCLSSSDAQAKSLKEFKVELQAMELAFTNFSAPIINSLQMLKAELSKIFQQADSAALSLDQSRSDLALTLEQSSFVVTATNVVNVEVSSAVVNAEQASPAPAKQPSGTPAGGKQA